MVKTTKKLAIIIQADESLEAFMGCGLKTEPVVEANESHQAVLTAFTTEYSIKKFQKSV